MNSSSHFQSQSTNSQKIPSERQSFTTVAGSRPDFRLRAISTSTLFWNAPFLPSAPGHFTPGIRSARDQAHPPLFLPTRLQI
jgi:hypothetical protein